MKNKNTKMSPIVKGGLIFFGIFTLLGLLLQVKENPEEILVSFWFILLPIIILISIFVAVTSVFRGRK